MIAAFDKKNCQCDGVVDNFIRCFCAGEPLSQAVAETLFWMNNIKREHQTWHPASQQLEQLLAVAANPKCNSETLYWLSHIFGEEKSLQAVDILLSHLSTSPAHTNRTYAVEMRSSTITASCLFAA